MQSKCNSSSLLLFDNKDVLITQTLSFKKETERLEMEILTRNAPENGKLNLKDYHSEYLIGADSIFKLKANEGFLKKKSKCQSIDIYLRPKCLWIRLTVVGVETQRNYVRKLLTDMGIAGQVIDLPDIYCSICYSREHMEAVCNNCSYCLSSKHNYLTCDKVKIPTIKHSSNTRPIQNPKDSNVSDFALKPKNNNESQMKQNLKNKNKINPNVKKPNTNNINRETADKSNTVNTQIVKKPKPNRNTLSNKQRQLRRNIPACYWKLGKRYIYLEPLDSEDFAIDVEKSEGYDGINLASQVIITNIFKGLGSQVIYYARLNHTQRIVNHCPVFNGNTLPELLEGSDPIEVRNDVLNILRNRRVFVHSGIEDFKSLAIFEFTLMENNIELVDLALMHRDPIYKYVPSLADMVYVYLAKKIQKYDPKMPERPHRGHAVEIDSRYTLKLGMECDKGEQMWTYEEIAYIIEKECLPTFDFEIQEYKKKFKELKERKKERKDKMWT